MAAHLTSSEQLDVGPPVISCKSLALKHFCLAILSQLILVLPQAGQDCCVLSQVLAELLCIADARSCQGNVSVDVSCIDDARSSAFVSEMLPAQHIAL